MWKIGLFRNEFKNRQEKSIYIKIKNTTEKSLSKYNIYICLFCIFYIIFTGFKFF